MPLLIHAKDENTILYYTKWGLCITAVFSIALAMLFEYAVDIWYMVGSFTVPTLLIPLIAGLYNVKLKNPLIVMMLPMSISIIWYICGIIFSNTSGPLQNITVLDPMYPGVIASIILFLFNKSK